jgi:hypothetical protein
VRPEQRRDNILYRQGEVYYSIAQDRTELKREEERTGEDRKHMIVQGRTGDNWTVDSTGGNSAGQDRTGRDRTEQEGQNKNDRARRTRHELQDKT